MEYKGRQLREQAQHMRPFAENLGHCVEALRGGSPPPESAWLHPHPGAAQSPRLAYDRATLDCFLAEVAGEDPAVHLAQAVEDLGFALATEKDRANAAADPCFGALHAQEGFRRLTGVPVPAHFLDLAPFAPYRTRLEEAGVTSAAGLLLRTGAGGARGELAARLGVPVEVVQRLRDVARLTEVHPDLNDPRMVHLLTAVDAGSPERLHAAAREDGRLLVGRVRARAAEDELGALRGVESPWRWLSAARR